MAADRLFSYNFCAGSDVKDVAWGRGAHVAIVFVFRSSGNKVSLIFANFVDEPLAKASRRHGLLTDSHIAFSISHSHRFFPQPFRPPTLARCVPTVDQVATPIHLHPLFLASQGRGMKIEQTTPFCLDPYHSYTANLNPMIPIILLEHGD